MAKKKKKPISGCTGQVVRDTREEEAASVLGACVQEGTDGDQAGAATRAGAKREDKTALDFQQQLNEARREAGKRPKVSLTGFPSGTQPTDDAVRICLSCDDAPWWGGASWHTPSWQQIQGGLTSRVTCCILRTCRHSKGD